MTLHLQVLPSGLLSLDATSLGAVAAGLAIGVLLVWWHSIRRGIRGEQALQSPQRLFRELCRVHRLSAVQRRLLEWLVTDRHLVQPAIVFLDPVLLESAIARSEQPGVRKRLTDLRARLFAEL